MLEASSGRSGDLSRIAWVLAPVTLGASLLLSINVPASANPVVLQSCSYSQTPSAHFIYGSPISTPVPVNPYTGIATTSPVNQSYGGCNFRNVNPPSGLIQNSILVNPTLVNPNISNSVIVSPGIVNSPIYPDTYIQRSRFIYRYPWGWR
jgi:hypothetical protein